MKTCLRKHTKSKLTKKLNDGTEDRAAPAKGGMFSKPIRKVLIKGPDQANPRYAELLKVAFSQNHRTVRIT